MASIQQVQKGFTKFVDNHVAGAYSGIDKVLVLGGSALLANNFPNIAKIYGSHPAVVALGIYNAETGNVDIDAVYNAIAPNMGESKIPVTLPKMGSINLGTIKLGKEEIDMIMRYIREA